MSQPIGVEPIEPVPETSFAERVVADVQPIGAFDGFLAEARGAL